MTGEGGGGGVLGIGTKSNPLISAAAEEAIVFLFERENGDRKKDLRLAGAEVGIVGDLGPIPNAFAAVNALGVLFDNTTGSSKSDGDVVEGDAVGDVAEDVPEGVSKGSGGTGGACTSRSGGKADFEVGVFPCRRANRVRAASSSSFKASAVNSSPVTSNSWL